MYYKLSIVLYSRILLSTVDIKGLSLYIKGYKRISQYSNSCLLLWLQAMGKEQDKFN